MNKQIPGFSNYALTENNEVIRISDSKIMPIYVASDKGTKFLKLKNDEGIFKRVGYNSLITKCLGVTPPQGFFQVPGFEYLWCTKSAEFWSAPNHTFPAGKYLTIYYPKNGWYPVVSTREKGQVSVHQLLALTFLDKEYLEKGLCVMHLDDNKHNFNLSNFKIGTYSENNKAAYDTGVNPSKKQ